VACEFSGRVRDAFIARGHDAISCDLLPTESSGPHIQGDVCEIDLSRFDLMIAHPPCTYLANSGARWLYTDGRGTERDEQRWGEMRFAAAFFRFLLNAPVPRVAVENPRMNRHAGLPPADQFVQPWQFGDGETKATGLWLRGLPKLAPTNVVDGRVPRVHHEAPSAERWKNRSRTYQGIADAMAEQWGSL